MKISDDKKDRQTLRSYFVKNAIPKEGEFAQLIGSALNQREDGVVKEPGEPLSIEAVGDLGKSLNLYLSRDDVEPAFSIALRSRVGRGAVRPGLNITDGKDNSRLSIDAASGNVGIGTTAPGAKLEVVGGVSVAGPITVGAGADLNLRAAAGSTDAGDVVFLSSDGSQKARIWSDPGATTGLYISGSDIIPKLAIGADGNVGIGTATPSRRFVVGSNDVSGLGMDPGDVSPNAGYIRFGDNTGWKLHLGRSREAANGALNAGANGIIMTLHDRGNVGIGTTSPRAKLEVAGAIMPAWGNSEAAGILFPPDPGGGGSDRGWIRYYPRSGEAMTLEIGTSNDADDDIALKPTGGVAVGMAAAAGYRLNIAARDDVWQNALAICGDQDIRGKDRLTLMRFGNAGDYQLLHKAKGRFQRNTLALHCEGGDALGFYSTGWTPLLEVAGGTGDTYVRGGLEIGGSAVYLTQTDHGHTGNGNLPGYAAIENARDYDALMILGRAGTNVGRKVRLWDFLEVNGPLWVTANAFKPGGGAWGILSDERLKKNIRPLEGALDRMLSLRGVVFEWKQPERQGDLAGPQMGMVAQEVEQVFPEWVAENALSGYADAMKSVTVRGFEALTVEALREMKALVDAIMQQIVGAESSGGAATKAGS